MLALYTPPTLTLVKIKLLNVIQKTEIMVKVKLNKKETKNLIFLVGITGLYQTMSVGTYHDTK